MFLGGKSEEFSSFSHRIKNTLLFLEIMITYEYTLTPTQLDLVAHVVECTNMAHLEIRMGPSGWTMDKTYRVARATYGIIGVNYREFEQKGTGYLVDQYLGYIMPVQNAEASFEALQTGVFRKEITEGDLEVLRMLFEKNSEIRTKGRRGLIRFYPSYVARVLGIGADRAREHLSNLTGLLGMSLINRQRWGQGTGYPALLAKKSSRISWFIPACRFDTIDELLCN